MEPVRSDDFYQMIKPQLCGLLDLLRVGVVFDRARGEAQRIGRTHRGLRAAS